jgi:hypothetical protein
MSMRCIRCRGTGQVDRLVFNGRKTCPDCQGSGQVPDFGDMYDEAKQGYREWRDCELRPTPEEARADFEAGRWAPASAAEDWAADPGDLGEDL